MIREGKDLRLRLMSRLKVQTLVLASRKEESDMDVNRFRVEPGSNRPSLVYIWFSLSLCMVGAVGL